MRNHLLGILTLVAGLGFVPVTARAQMSLASIRPVAENGCDAPRIADRLRQEHPMRAAVAGPCGTGTEWVAAHPLDREQRATWIRASRLLGDIDDQSCRAAGRMLDRIERSDLARVWQEPDTTGGMIYFGATYLAADETPLGIHLWTRAFDRPFGWLVGALAHEAFHVMAPHAREEEAIAFGIKCGDRAAGRIAFVAAGNLPDSARRLLGRGGDD